MSKTICVYCASSRRCDPEYHEAAFRLGCVLVDAGFGIVYGGGATGSMGALADGALSRGGPVIGVLPRFMKELERGHTKLPELRVVEDHRTRKHMRLSASQGLVALPGGSGTLEELLEAITLKRLSLYTHPILLLDTRGSFGPLVKLLECAVSERFMDERHFRMWQVVTSPDAVPDALEKAPSWTAEAREFATLLCLRSRHTVRARDTPIGLEPLPRRAMRRCIRPARAQRIVRTSPRREGPSLSGAGRAPHLGTG